MITAQQARNSTMTDELSVIEYKIMHATKQGAFWIEAHGDKETEASLKSLGYKVVRLGDVILKISW